jgi:cyanophycin synthetase
MFAAALAWAQGIDPATIRHALGTFTASVEQNPGRYNFLDGFPFQVILDYAHNPAGVEELCRVARALPVAGRRIVCNVHVGNRHPSHLAVAVPVLAKTFDAFVLGCYSEELSPEYAAGGAEPLEAMLAKSERLLAAAGVVDSSITSVADPLEAIRTALGLGEPGDLVVLLAAPEEVLPVVEALLGEAGPVPSTP